MTTISVTQEAIVAVALPQAPRSSGLVWRVAREIEGRVLRQQAEGDVGPNVVLTFHALGRGGATQSFAQTRGEGSRTAVRAAFFRIRVS